MLAEISSAPSFTAGELASFLGILAFLVALVLGLKKLFGHSPPLHKEYAARGDHEKLEKKVETNEAKNTSARKGIYGSLDSHAARLAALEADKRTTSEKLADVESKIDDNTKLTSEMKGEMKGIGQNVERVQNSITHFLQNAAQKSR